MQRTFQSHSYGGGCSCASCSCPPSYGEVPPKGERTLAYVLLVLFGLAIAREGFAYSRERGAK